MIQAVDFIFHFGGKANAMQFVAFAQSADRFADFADFANPRMRIAVFDIDSDQLDAFKPADQQGLEMLVGWFATTRK